MSENVRAILDEAGHSEVAVYRMSPSAIGCSLAEAAESEQYNRLGMWRYIAMYR
jgi:quinolinate synthase